MEAMTVVLLKNPEIVAATLAEIRDFKRVQQNTPIPVEEDPWFSGMFPILYALRGIFGTIPPMENLETEEKEEESSDEEDAPKATLEEDKAPEVEGALEVV
jgi:hypothetical protein